MRVLVEKNGKSEKKIKKIEKFFRFFSNSSCVIFNFVL